MLWYIYDIFVRWVYGLDLRDDSSKEILTRFSKNIKTLNQYTTSIGTAIELLGADLKVIRLMYRTSPEDFSDWEYLENLKFCELNHIGEKWTFVRLTHEESYMLSFFLADFY